MNKQNKKGITLIALVITIIVLLILAGISINAIFGENGLITQAQLSAFVTEMQGIKEKVHIKQMEQASNIVQRRNYKRSIFRKIKSK